LLNREWVKFNNQGFNKIQKDSIRSNLQKLDKKIQDRFYNFGDTVSSSAAFMENYDYIDFKDDYNKMKSYLIKALKRFPQAMAIARLKEQVLKAIHIREKELQTGDVFPRLSLPDLDGQLHTTDSANGKFTIIFFWATWCQKCMAYDKVKFELAGMNQFKKLDIISVAIDDHQKICKQIAEGNKQPGLQLIDKDIWQGQVAEKIAFDSIPFNFLIGPDQHIIAKAIPPDSVVNTLTKFIH
jgi:thiol-disulfide isomerase/thioredoxin